MRCTFTKFSPIFTGHGSLDGSSCGGSDHDLRAASAGSPGAAEEPKKQVLEAANSMPILSLLSCHQVDEENAYEIELEDERKYLPTDLFRDEHEKLCSTKSHNGKWEMGNCRPANVIRKTTSLNVQQEEEDGFTLFSSDQLDLLSSVRSNWNKTSSASEGSSSGSDYGGDMTAAMATCTAQDSSGLMMQDPNNFEEAMKNLTQEMGTMILRKM